MGATPPPARPMTPATPTGINIVPGMHPAGAGYPYPGAAVNIPFSQGNTFPYIGSVPNAAGGASTYIYAPTSQPPPPQYHQAAQPRFRAAAPVTSAREATSQVIAGMLCSTYAGQFFAGFFLPNTTSQKFLKSPRKKLVKSNKTKKFFS